jgi:hypothetical protein
LAVFDVEKKWEVLIIHRDASLSSRLEIKDESRNNDSYQEVTSTLFFQCTVIPILE